jgi:hypothetical protein
MIAGMRLREFIGMMIRIPLAAAAGVAPIFCILTIGATLVDSIPGWIVPTVTGIFISPIFIWVVVKLMNRKDDPRHQKPPPDAP